MLRCSNHAYTTKDHTVSEDNKRAFFSFWTFHFQNNNKTFAPFLSSRKSDNIFFSCFSWKMRNNFCRSAQNYGVSSGSFMKDQKINIWSFYLKKRISLKLCHMSHMSNITHYTAMIFHKTKSASKDLQIIHVHVCIHNEGTISEHQKITISLLTLRICTKIANSALFSSPPSSETILFLLMK